MGHVRGTEKRQQPQFNFHFNLYVLHSHHFNFNLELTIEAYSEWLFMPFPINPPRGMAPYAATNCHGKWATPEAAAAALYANQRFALMTVHTHTHTRAKIYVCECLSKYEQILIYATRLH